MHAGGLGRRGFLGALALAAAGARCRRRAAQPDERPFRVALPNEVNTLDPHASTTTGAFIAAGNIYEPLMAMQASRGIKAALAQHWSSPDPHTWVFALRPGVRFHSGRTCGARDVVYSLERARRDPALDARYYLGDVGSVEALDASTIRLRAVRRTPALLYKIAHVFIVPEGYTPEQRADGTGPYAVTAWEAGRLLSLARHAAYWGGPPAIAKASLGFAADADEVVRGLAGGTLEMAQLQLTRQGEALAASPRHRLIRRASLFVSYLGFDLGRPLTPFLRGRPNAFRDRRVREAFHLALDRPRLTARLPFYATPANQLVPREVFGYAGDLAEAEHRPERARALLAAAGLGSGFATTLHTRQTLGESARLAAEQLREVGIELELKVLPDAAYFAGLARREFSLWLDRWSCTTGESAELFETGLHTADAVSGLGVFNESRYSDLRLDTAIREAVEVEQPRERRTALEGLMRMAMTALPWIPLYTIDEVWAIDSTFDWRSQVDYWLHLEDIRRA